MEGTSDAVCAVRHNNWMIFVCLSWLAGLFLGCQCAGKVHPYIFSLIYGAVTAPVSIAAAFIVCLIPFLLSYIALHYLPRFVILLFILVKGFAFSFVSVMMITAFGPIGWLMRFFLMFSELLSIPVFFFYWIRNRTVSHTLSLISLLLSIGSIYYFVVLPFWVRLIDS